MSGGYTAVIRNGISDIMAAQMWLPSLGKLRFGFGERLGCCSWDPGIYFYNRSSELRNSSQNLNLSWGWAPFPIWVRCVSCLGTCSFTFRCLNSTLASFLYHAVQNGTSNLDRQRGWIYLLVYLLVIKGKEMNSQTGIWDFSSTQAHVPFSSLSKQVWQERAILVCYSWSSHTHL